MESPHIVLGIGAGIAAYKTPELVRALCAAGAAVTPVLTRNAVRFVTTTSLQAVAGVRPRGDLWDEEAEAGMGHIELARAADALLIAPATANLMARMAHGLADDLLTTLYLATTAPVFIAPAMNTRMWEHAATRRNHDRLIGDGVQCIGPCDGEQACGEVGVGRMEEPKAIAETVLAAIRNDVDLSGVRVLLTSGPTRENIDPVRYISNRSSGRQGFALAEAFARCGARVTVIAGPVHVATPAGVQRVDVTSAAQMKQAVAERVSDADIFVGVAAVADYRPVQAHERKIKRSEKGGAELSIALTENDDILQFVADGARRPFVVGFAAETHDAMDHARQKRARKKLDAIVVNDVSDVSIGFDSTDNAVTFISESAEVTLPKAPKDVIARQLVTEIAKLYRNQKPTVTAVPGG